MVCENDKCDKNKNVKGQSVGAGKSLDASLSEDKESLLLLAMSDGSSFHALARRYVCQLHEDKRMVLTVRRVGGADLSFCRL